MIEKIKNILINKSIAILGFGREGKSTYEFIRKFVGNTPLTIIDQNNVYETNKDLFNSDNNVSFIYGDNYLNDLEKYDLVIKTPGISLKDINTTNINITSQIELLLKVNKEHVIGVTGTKGKSTTSSLIYSILKENNVPSVLAGNIGIPVFSILEGLDENTTFVVEMSSHQLEYLDVSPHIGIVLNLFEDHLDHAGSVKHYHEIKMHMFSHQDESDYMVYCSDNDTLNNLINANNFKGKKITVDLKNKNATIYLDNNEIYYNSSVVFNNQLPTNLLGMHNLENIMVAYAVSKVLRLDDANTLKAIKEFKSLPYRLELIGKVNDVKYYVDTLATIPNATLEAIGAIKDINTLIFGGMNRGISYDGFADALSKSNIKHFICMPTTGHVIGADLPKDRTYFVDTLEQACELAKEITEKNTSCILSPAAASYEYFKNYAEKGDKFKEYILK